MNKIVYKQFDFNFVMTLTWIHTIFTWAGMRLFLAMNFFSAKDVEKLKLLPLAWVHVGYIVLGNLSLQMNTVSFYQIMKIAIAPTLVLLEFFMFGKVHSLPVMGTVAMVCLGVAVATVTDKVAVSNTAGAVVGFAATLTTALFQIWAGSKQKEFGVNSSQLLLNYLPQATLYLGLLVPIIEPIGVPTAAPGTLMAYPLTPAAAAVIILSALLGVLVTFTTFLVIGATSSLTYNIIGHMKTVIIIGGGCLAFGDSMSPLRCGV